QPGCGRRLTRTGRAHEDDVAFAAVQPLVEFRDGGWLVARGFVLADDLEFGIAALDLPHGAKFGVGQLGTLCCKSHVSILCSPRGGQPPGDLAAALELV